jgi:hypothetical protein
MTASAIAPGCGRSGDEPPAARKGAAPAPAPAGAASTEASAPAAGRRPCTAGAVRGARRASEALVKRGDYAAARRRLDDSLAGCDLDAGDAARPNLDYFWVQSDRAFLAYKTKDLAACLRILAPLTSPSQPLGIHALHLAGWSVGQAILHDEDLCRSASPDPRAGFESRPCPLAPGADETAIGLPADALPEGARAGCLVLEASAGPDAFRRSLEGGDDARTDLCGPLVLRTGQPGASATGETRLVAEGGPLQDPSVCCNLDKISFSALGGARRIRVQGRGLECTGGTTDADLDAVYTWQGDHLALEKDDPIDGQ